MPKFKDRDKVVISEDAKSTVTEVLGEAGTIMGPGLPMERRTTTRAAEGESMTAERTDIWYAVLVDRTGGVVNVEESDLALA